MTKMSSGASAADPVPLGFVLRDEDFATIASAVRGKICLYYSRLPTACCYHGAGESVAAHSLWCVEGRAARVQRRERAKGFLEVPRGREGCSVSKDDL